MAASNGRVARRKRVVRLLALGASVALLTAVWPTPGASLGAKKGKATELTVMTRNLYLGGDLFPILGAPTGEDAFEQAYVTWGIIQGTDFPARAKRLADEIAATNPDVVGLQEVTTYRTDSPADGPATPATTIAYDFLQTLLDELTSRGLSYTMVVQQTNTDIEIPLDPDPDPGTTPGSLTGDVRYTDGDAILVRSGVKVLGTAAEHFDARFSATVAIGTVTILRGWTSVDLRIAGQKARVVNTHLEVDSDANALFGAVQEAQAGELVKGPLGTSMPTILLGDLNSKADGTGTTTYGQVIGAGMEDVWPSTHPGDPGFTCCHDETLTNPTSEHDERIDLVMTRGPWGHFSSDILGEDVADKTPGGLWPSDHSGVVATVALGTCHGRLATIVGGPSKDRLKGTGKADIVQAFDGKDTVSTKGGKDVVCGGDHPDVLKTGSGDDRVEGEAGNDLLVAGSGTDVCVGGPGKDRGRGCEGGAV
jgi:endonuclease/exonuclease/phosphatase family metal-dependent hydrolase